MRNQMNHSKIGWMIGVMVLILGCQNNTGLKTSKDKYQERANASLSRLASRIDGEVARAVNTAASHRRFTRGAINDFGFENLDLRYFESYFGVPYGKQSTPMVYFDYESRARQCVAEVKLLRTHRSKAETFGLAMIKLSACLSSLVAEADSLTHWMAYAEGPNARTQHSYTMNPIFSLLSQYGGGASREYDPLQTFVAPPEIAGFDPFAVAVKRD